MAAKKKKMNIEKLYSEDELMIALKERFFKLYAREDIGKTQNLTTTIDKVQAAIFKRMEELRNA
jgi:hypothetical protein